MKRSVTTLVEGLGHPEGPDVLPDGRIVMVETYTGKIVAWSQALGRHDYANCGGGPNACVLGSDGAVYITQNGGTAGPWRAAVMSTPSIQRCWPDGRCEIVVSSVAGVDVQAPNDLAFGADGRLYFTDPADYDPDHPGRGRIFALGPDGSGEVLEDRAGTYPNGIVAEADGSIVWVDSYRSEVYRRRPGEESQRIARLPEGHIPDGLKIDADSNLWITAYTGGGVDILCSDGTVVDFLDTGGCPLNCVFHEGALYIADQGEVTGSMMDGRLLRVDVGVQGMAPFRGAIA